MHTTYQNTRVADIWNCSHRRYLRASSLWSKKSQDVGKIKVSLANLGRSAACSAQGRAGSVKQRARCGGSRAYEISKFKRPPGQRTTYHSWRKNMIDTGIRCLACLGGICENVTLKSGHKTRRAPVRWRCGRRRRRSNDGFARGTVGITECGAGCLGVKLNRIVWWYRRCVK